MLILLPPSEGKTAPATGVPVDLDSLSFPQLRVARAERIAELAAVSGRPDALAVLKVGKSVADQVAGNLDLLNAPAAAARDLYTGVLFGAAGLNNLAPTASVRAQESVRIFSAIWGVVTPADQIPAYRLSMGVPLPKFGNLSASWRPHLSPVFDAEAAGDIVIDCRSSSYVQAWHPATAELWASVTVLREVAGKRSVVSHHAKFLRGVLTRHLLTRRAAPPKTGAALLKAAQELVGMEFSGDRVIAVELSEAKAVPGKATKATLSLITELVISR